MTTRTMTATLALALGLLAGLGCEDESSCDVDLDKGELQDRLCESVELVADCMGEMFPDYDPQSAEFEGQVEQCFDSFDICSIDPSLEHAAMNDAIREIRGDTNECIG